MYTCGPTIYGLAHIGNLSTYLFMDFLKKYLRFSGYEVKDVMNFTDVDDKTIKASREKGVELKKYTKGFGEAILADFEKLKIEKPKIICKATDHIQEMVKLVEVLVKKGVAYKAEDGSIYFDIDKFAGYGKFAGLKRKGLVSGASGRILADEYEKQKAADFVLWKAWGPGDGEVFWDLGLGKGRPGWHIECSAMSMKYLGESFDIHVGAIDLIFPHHQNEIAQSEAATGKKFVKYWLHRGFLQIDKDKMSKSRGNLYTLGEILEKVEDPMAFRYLVLTSHYRKPLNFTFEALESAKRSLDRLREFGERIEKIRKGGEIEKGAAEVEGKIEKIKKSFKGKMDNDLDSSGAMGSIFEFVNEVNKLMDEGKLGKKEAEMLGRLWKEMDQVWGFLLIPKMEKGRKGGIEEIKRLVSKRDKLRKEEKWGEADKIKEQLSKMGVWLKDGPKGTEWKIR